YFPLGGSRVDKQWKVYRNLFIVWFLTGFWHGASWNYILWGLYYFVLLVIEKAFIGDILKKLPAFFQHLYTLFFVLFGWLLFVFEDLSAGMVWLGNMFGVGTYKFIDMGNVYDLLRNIVFFAVLVIACTPGPKKLFYRLYEKHRAVHVGAFAGGVVIMVLCIAYLVDSSFNPFLYFRF
ncbi:MAG: MBOAT family protein, partial [Eubacteriales bacterium]|nr:MBOAT family protein [Eubacteriales bacterium]